MNTKSTLALLAILGAVALTASAQDSTNSAASDTVSTSQHLGAPARGFHLIPPPLTQQLNLTDDQKTQLAALETDTKAKLEKILTTDQMQQLNDFRPQRGGKNRSSGQNGDATMPPPGGGDDTGAPAGPPPSDGQ